MKLLQKLKVGWPDATLFYFISFSFHRQYIHTFLHQWTFAEAPLHSIIAEQLSGRLLPGVPSRDSNSGPPYSEPTCYQLSHAAPYNWAMPHPAVAKVFSKYSSFLALSTMKNQTFPGWFPGIPRLFSPSYWDSAPWFVCSQYGTLDWGEGLGYVLLSPGNHALIKKKVKFSSYIRKFRVEQLQSHIWGRASWYMRKCENIYQYMRRPLVIYDVSTVPFWISLYVRNISFLFYQCAGSGLPPMHLAIEDGRCQR